MGWFYRPKTDRISHYFRARIREQFDAVIHVDETHAVEPLERTSQWDEGELLWAIRRGSNPRLAAERPWPMRTGMRIGTFLEIIEQAAGTTREEAEKAARATLQTLAERITLGEAEDIAAFLPKELRGVMTSVPEPAESFGLDEFVGRVAEREHVDRDTAYARVRAVFEALAQAVAPGELGDMAAQLSKDYNPLLQAAGIEETQSPEVAVDRVAELAALDSPHARRAVEAVLETLAVRISEGEVSDLMKKVPSNLRGPLERGLAESRKATRMSLEEFLVRIAEREGVDRDDAELHARAVFAALRDYVSSKEIHDVESEICRANTRLCSPVPSEIAPMSTTLERGDIFFYRPRVGIDEVRSLEDVQRFFFVLHPDGASRSGRSSSVPSGFRTWSGTSARSSPGSPTARPTSARS